MWVALDLTACTGHHPDAVGLQRRELEPIALEGRPARMRVVAVDLHHEAPLAPEEVDLVAGDHGIDLGSREAGVGDEREESLLELAAGDLGAPQARVARAARRFRAPRDRREASRRST